MKRSKFDVMLREYASEMQMPGGTHGKMFSQEEQPEDEDGVKKAFSDYLQNRKGLKTQFDPNRFGEIYDGIKSGSNPTAGDDLTAYFDELFGPGEEEELLNQQPRQTGARPTF